MSFDEFIEFVTKSETRYEWHGGEIFEMSGASVEHARICANVIIEIGSSLRDKPCQAFSSSLMVKVEADDVSDDRLFFPDITVVCGPVEYAAGQQKKMTLINPTLIIEVLSPSTSGYDRGDKFHSYRKLPSLKQYVLIDQAQALVEVRTRQENLPGTKSGTAQNWLLQFITGTDASTDASTDTGTDNVLALESIGVSLPVSRIYAGVEFPVVVEPMTESESRG